MTVLKIIAAVLIFGLIIFIHEFGHFLAAVSVGVKVIEFSLGMGPRIFTIHGKLTDYSIKLLPIGGSCQMKGETEDGGSDEDSFSNKKPWKRFLIIFCGPFFNFLLAFLAAIVLISNVGSDLPLIGSVTEGYPAQEAGIQPGDMITRINHREIRLFRELQLYNALHPGDPQTITVQRKGEPELLTFTLVPQYSESEQRYLIGIVSTGEAMMPENIVEALKYSFYELRFNILSSIDSVLYMISGHFSRNDIMGPVGIISDISDTVETTFSYGWRIMILTILDYILLFSSNIGVLNLIPFPALDGGRLLFIFIEWITGKRVNEMVENTIHLIGFALLMLFMVWVVINDISKII